MEAIRVIELVEEGAVQRFYSLNPPTVDSLDFIDQATYLEFALAINKYFNKLFASYLLTHIG